MAYSFRNKNPKNAGVLIREKVSCGKKNCHCANGEQFHEATYLYYRDYLNGGKLRKQYIPKAELCMRTLLVGLSKFNDRQKKMSFYDRLEALERLTITAEYYREMYPARAASLA